MLSISDQLKVYPASRVLNFSHSIVKHVRPVNFIGNKLQLAFTGKLVSFFVE